MSASAFNYNNLKPIDERDSSGSLRRDSIVSLATICNNYSSENVSRDSMETAIVNEPVTTGGRILGTNLKMRVK